MLAHAPHAAMPTVEALVGGEDDQGLLVEPEVGQRLQDPTHAVVDAADRRGITPNGHVIVDQLLPEFLPRVDLLARE